MRTVFLKLGGSLITDKRTPETPRPNVVDRLATEVAQALRQDPELRLVLGHGSGSYGHVYGSKYGTRDGVETPEQWYGYAATGDAAARLNRIVVEAFLRAGIPAWSVQPGAILRCRAGAIVDGDPSAVVSALERGLVPVVYGDVVLDEEFGGTIASTEEIFEWMLPSIHAQRLVLAGEVDGIYTADPQLDNRAELVQELTPETVAAVAQGLGKSHGVDVTGGMSAKVAQAVRMVRMNPDLEIIVCGGLRAGAVLSALRDDDGISGTRISA